MYYFSLNTCILYVQIFVGTAKCHSPTTQWTQVQFPLCHIRFVEEESVRTGFVGSFRYHYHSLLCVIQVPLPISSDFI